MHFSVSFLEHLFSLHLFVYLLVHLFEALFVLVLMQHYFLVNFQVAFNPLVLQVVEHRLDFLGVLTFVRSSYQIIKISQIKVALILHLILKQPSLTMLNKQNLHNESRADRFIPNSIRSCTFQLEPPLHELPTSNYQLMLGKNMLNQTENIHQQKIMNFSSRNSVFPSIRSEFASENHHHNGQTRKISRKPYKVLDAPNLQDDFYLNLLDWSQRNQIAVALDTSVYLWSGCSSEITRLYSTSQSNDYICSLTFCKENQIAVGNTQGQIRLFDIAKKKKINCFEGHYGRIGSLDWCNNLLASGSRDGNVIIWDPRVGQVGKYKAHSQEICGLKWSPDGSYIASGGNDNKLSVFSTKSDTQLVRFHEHRAAVKAIGWCPSNPGTLASGGGTADRHIRFFSMQSLRQTYSIDTGSQICNLAFSKISNQMVTTHGYSLNQINIWNTSSNWQQKTINKVTTLTGHTYRVLYLAVSPNGDSILTGAGDQTLRFWNVFDSSQYKPNQTVNIQMDLR